MKLHLFLCSVHRKESSVLRNCWIMFYETGSSSDFPLLWTLEIEPSMGKQYYEQYYETVLWNIFHFALYSQHSSARLHHFKCYLCCLLCLDDVDSLFSWIEIIIHSGFIVNHFCLGSSFCMIICNSPLHISCTCTLHLYIRILCTCTFGYFAPVHLDTLHFTSLAQSSHLRASFWWCVFMWEIVMIKSN